MSIIQMLLKEMDMEAVTTRKMLERVPNDRYDWKPHEKSMSIRMLTTHIAELPTWVTMALVTDGLNFADSPYQPPVINSTNELLELFEKSLKNGREHLAAATDEQLLPTWTLRNGEEVVYVATKGETIRMTFSQIVHHRAQLGVYLRLLNIPIPGSYGPSADEH
ncbi:DinB family protein [Mucilaginibacter arboris]|uniref:DinB family protein n=1 Tax=Mucilaginibacter arboris TaxID=2682090 RepID=A0A7K1T1L6_9SPHI|nr:DinB family protein [Mucilaginibacter arboris]MVN23418.1 DinB family protein [Mucilaginibacter arboris]